MRLKSGNELGWDPKRWYVAGCDGKFRDDSWIVSDRIGDKVIRFHVPSGVWEREREVVLLAIRLLGGRLPENIERVHGERIPDDSTQSWGDEVRIDLFAE